MLSIILTQKKNFKAHKLILKKHTVTGITYDAKSRFRTDNAL